MTKIIIAMAFSLLSLFSCKAFTNLDPDAFQARLEGDGAVQLVDVRTPDEFAAGHIAGAVNIDWYASDFLEKARAALSKDSPVLLYCRSGKRSAAASAKLSKEGFKVFNLEGGYLAWTGAGRSVTAYTSWRFCTKMMGETDYAADFPKADAILVTHEHADHFDPEAIGILSKDGTQLVTNARCAQMLGYGTVLANGDSFVLAEGVRLDAVPAYNTTEGHLQFHPKGRDNGFVLDIDGLRIYIAGDTEDIPEIAALKDIDVAFLPVNQPYTMTPEQCIAAAKVIAPKVLIPYHSGRTDLSGIPAALPGIDVRVR